MRPASSDLRLPEDAHGPAPLAPVLPWRRVAVIHVQAWCSRHARSLTWVAPLLLITAVVHGRGSGAAPGYTDDEGTYTAQAYAVRDLHRLAHYTYWYDHPPLGWIQLAGWQWLTNPFLHGPAVGSARAFLVVLSVVDAALIYVLARRLGAARVFAGLAVLLWALSPLVVATSRQVYLDGIALPWLLAAFVLAASPRRALWAQVGAGLCFGVAVLSKETMLLLLPALLYLARQHSDRRTRAFCTTGLVTAFVIVVAFYPLLALLKGELVPGAGHVSLLDALRFQLWARPSTGSALSTGTVSRSLLDGWLARDTWLLALGLVAILPGLLIRRTRPIAVALLTLVLVGVRPGYLPESYIVPVLPFAALVVAVSTSVLWSAGASGRGRRLAVRATVCVAGVAALLAAGPAWAAKDRDLMVHSQTSAFRAAEHWLVRHADRHVRVVVDDSYWEDLVHAGFPAREVIWLYKTDFVTNLDPSVARYLRRPADLGYVVVSPVVRATLAQSDPTSYALVRAAISGGQVVATFGRGAETVQIVHVTSTG